MITLHVIPIFCLQAHLLTLGLYIHIYIIQFLLSPLSMNINQKIQTDSEKASYYDKDGIYLRKKNSFRKNKDNGQHE